MWCWSKVHISSSAALLATSESRQHPLQGLNTCHRQLNGQSFSVDLRVVVNAPNQVLLPFPFV